MSPIGFRYFVKFVDDYLQTTWLYLMKNRFELFSHFRAFHAEIQTQFHVYVQNMRSDNAKDSLSEQFKSCMLQNGILHQTSCVDTPSQNEVAERKNRHLHEIAWALLFQMLVPKHFWADAVSSACFFFLIGCLPLFWIGLLCFKPSFPINLCFQLSLGDLGVLVLFGMFVCMCLNSILSH